MVDGRTGTYDFLRIFIFLYKNIYRRFSSCGRVPGRAASKRLHFFRDTPHSSILFFEFWYVDVCSTMVHCSYLSSVIIFLSTISLSNAFTAASSSSSSSSPPGAGVRRGIVLSAASKEEVALVVVEDLQSQHHVQTPVEKMKAIVGACEELGIDTFDVYGDYTKGQFLLLTTICL